MSVALTYVIKFVADMNRAVAFHRDRLGLALRFQSPDWSEFETGSTTLALHVASPQHPAGSCQLGFGVPNLQAFFEDHNGKSLEFTSPPTDVQGHKIARFRDVDGAECSVSGP